MPIVWNDAKFGTGLPDIDEQHQEWFRRFNAFDAAIASGQGTEAIFNTLAFLVQYTETHFLREEEQMKICGCPALADNQRAHDEFRIRLDDMLSWLEKVRPTAVEVGVLKQEMEDWLTTHICTIDIKLRGCE